MYNSRVDLRNTIRVDETSQRRLGTGLAVIYTKLRSKCSCEVVEVSVCRLPARGARPRGNVILGLGPSSQVSALLAHCNAHI